ncbi:MAG: hypothetical protein FH751_14520 [Firmicutes bacterium]|nr:hypothetical protein [Bacillota bacterium]
MINSKELLILIYLNEYKDQYLLAEIKELCYFTTSQMKKYLQKMIEKEMLEDSNGRLLLTYKAEKFLKEKGLFNVTLSELFKDIVTLEFTEKPLSFQDVYIPKEFKI